ncbi:predicted protein [Naegleria gruberi]|uniref:Predicted protein n=1 Tax=Naegleria gruberi TaxID=5762 RepID=D2VU37_NAEGR|nr:uncharacterized protein NAEGRDRAFT_72524 [Naegleria gruberi]EFC39560.1 predicted protein [Naegleria gruberi]|eukprot:XP_002672304.1 predicted protein [Naegleria gruberi strain NEG-M]
MSQYHEQQQDDSFPISSIVPSNMIGMSDVITTNTATATGEDFSPSSLLPCEAYEKDGFCARGSTCKFKHESAIGNVNLIEFLFEYETIIPKATSKKVRKISEITLDTQKTNQVPPSPSSIDKKPMIRKSKKTKIEKKIDNDSINNTNTSSSTNQLTSASMPEEPFEIPAEYAEINFEKPIIPFNFSFHTPTFLRQSTLQELIDINMKNTTNRNKGIVLAYMKGKKIYQILTNFDLK